MAHPPKSEMTDGGKSATSGFCPKTLSGAHLLPTGCIQVNRALRGKRREAMGGKGKSKAVGKLDGPRLTSNWVRGG